MALTSLTAIPFAFVLLEDRLWSCAGDLWAQFISVYSQCFLHVERDLSLLAWEVKLRTLRG